MWLWSSTWFLLTWHLCQIRIHVLFLPLSMLTCLLPYYLPKRNMEDRNIWERTGWKCNRNMGRCLSQSPFVQFLWSSPQPDGLLTHSKANNLRNESLHHYFSDFSCLELPFLLFSSTLVVNVVSRSVHTDVRNGSKNSQGEKIRFEKK